MQYIGFANPGTAVGEAGPAERDASAVGQSAVELDFLSATASATASRSPRWPRTTAACSAAAAHQPVGEVTAIVGVATLPSARRRGLAALVTARLVQDARERGAELVFIEAEDDDVARIYGRLGFERVGTACIAAALTAVTMDRDEISAITHGDRPFHNPLDPARIDAAIDRLGLGPGDRVLDVGCGPGELLVRIAERTGAGGLGVDRSELVIEQARRRAAARAPEAALEFVAGDADGLEGAFAAACCLGSSHALGGLEPALEWLAGCARTVLLADGFWHASPIPRSSTRSAARPGTSCRPSRACWARARAPSSSRSGSPRAAGATGRTTSGR